MQSDILVSIIIPCYNQSQYLTQTFESLGEQTYKNWECVVVDDGSTDDSVEIVRIYARKDQRIRLILKANGGTSSARNLGVKEAKGCYIQFLDADDKLDKNKLQFQLQFMLSNNLDVSYTSFVSFYEKKSGELITTSISKWSVSLLINLRFSLLTRWGVDFSIPMHCWLYKSEFLSHNNILFNSQIKFREDWNFHLNISRLIRKGIGMVDYVGAFYRMNPTGKTSSYLKIIDGNLGYISYKWKELNLPEIFFWIYRLSLENWQTILRCLKHKEVKGLSSYKYLFNNLGVILLFLLSVLMMPLSFFHVLMRALITYL